MVFMRWRLKNVQWIVAVLLILALVLMAGCGKKPEETVIATVTVPEAVMETEPAIPVPQYTRMEIFSQQDIRDMKEAVLMLKGKPLLCVTEPERVDALEERFASAQNLGYEPQTYLFGIELLLIREDGMAVEVELGLLEDLCRMNGEFYDYGPGMSGEASVNGMEALYEALGLRSWTLETLVKWPVEVVEYYDYLLNSYRNEPKQVNTHFRAREFRQGKDSIVIRLADGTEKTAEAAWLDILKLLMFTRMDLALTPSGEVEALYEIEITFGNGDGTRTLYYQGDGQYLTCIDWGEMPLYKSFQSPELAEIAEKWTNIP